jgi:hypothetical protein
MSKKNARSLFSKLFVLSLLLISLVFATGTTMKPQTVMPSVVNTTKSLEVLKVAQADGAYVLTLKNNYDKAMNGFSVGTSPSSRHDVDYTVSDRLLLPGKVAEVDVPINNSEKSAQPQSIYVFAALFTDGTSDGDPKVVAENKQRRLGVKRQLQRISRLVESFLSSSDSNAPSSLEKLKSQISSLPEEPEAGQLGIVRSGLHSGKQIVLSQIQQFEQDAAQRKLTPLQVLTLIKDKVDKRISKL